MVAAYFSGVNPVDPAAQRGVEHARPEDIHAQSPWRVEWVEATGSTNDDLSAKAHAGEPAGLVIATCDQTAGHGRLGRTWTAPAGSALAMSVLVRPQRDTTAWSLLPLLGGMAVQGALATYGLGDDARLKWPNDVVMTSDELKISGVLCIAAQGAVVMGMGINTAMTHEQLPVLQATSMHLQGVEAYAQDVCDQVLAALSELLAMFEAGEDAALLERYRSLSATLGRQVRAHTPSGDVIGRAADIASDGALVIETDEGSAVVSAADVIHLRAH